MRICSTVALLTCAFAAGAAGPDVDRALENRVKAAYLYRFTEFVTWPDSAFDAPGSPLVIGVAGSDAIAAELAQVAAARTVAGRRVEVRGAAEPGAPVHVLFVAGSDRARLERYARAAPKHSLVISEADGALAHGSVINFVLVEGRVRFDVALDAAERRGLRLSARMLAVANQVRGP